MYIYVRAFAGYFLYGRQSSSGLMCAIKFYHYIYILMWKQDATWTVRESAKKSSK